jgi:hypothetical protein
MKTAVEWLVEQWPILESQIPERILKQAKEMERDQIIDAHSDWVRLTKNLPTRTAEQYYTETFNP